MAEASRPVLSEIEGHWTRFAESFGGNAERIPISDTIDAYGQHCTTEAEEHLRHWLLVFDEALQCSLQFEGFIKSIQNPRPAPAVLLLARRICAVLVGVRHLVVVGLEEPAAVLGRSLLESLDLCIVCIADSGFADRYLGVADEFDPNAFWKAEIGYGRIGKRLRSLRVALGYSETQLAQLDEMRQGLQLELSESVHSGSHSVMRAAIVPSLKHKALWSENFLGHISRRAPYLLSWISLEVHSFAENVFSIMRNEPAAAVSGAHLSSKTEGFLTAYMTLQELVVTYPHIIPPSAEWWAEHQGVSDE